MVSIHIEGGTNQYGFAIQRPCDPEIWPTTLLSISLQQDLNSIRLDVEGMVRLFFILLYKTIILTDIIHSCIDVVESFGGP